MSTSRKVSMYVVIPAYKVAGRYGRNLGSLIHQDFVDWRSMYIDDGSEDQTAALAARAPEAAAPALFDQAERWAIPTRWQDDEDDNELRRGPVRIGDAAAAPVSAWRVPREARADER